MSTPAAPAADAGDTAPDATVPGTGQNPAPNPAAPDAPAVPAVAGSEDVSSLPQWAQKQLTDARAEAAKSRTVAKQNAAQEATAEITQRLAEALGITPTTDTPPTRPRLPRRWPSSPRSCAQPRYRTPHAPPQPTSRPGPIGS